MMEQVIPWAKLCGLIEPHYPKTGNGRRPKELEPMLRIYFLQQWFKLVEQERELGRELGIEEYLQLVEQSAGWYRQVGKDKSRHHKKQRDCHFASPNSEYCAGREMTFI
jgi:hypothetical protein